MAEIDTSKYLISEDGKYIQIKPELLPLYKASLKEQINNWLLGISKHNDYWDECCPDFSCCGGELWPEELRKKFILADDETRTQMLMISLSGLFINEGLDKEVYITGDLPTTLH